MGDYGRSVTCRLVDVGRARLYAGVRGDGPGVPLLLINGIGTCMQMWEPLACRLAVGRRLVMFDAPGTGGSPALRRPLRMSELARLVVGLLDALGETQVDVLGYSWGGILAQQLVLDAPRRVRRLVLVSTTPGLGARPPAPLAMLASLTPLTLLLGRCPAVFTPLLFGGDRPYSAVPQDVRRWLDQPRRPWGYAAQLYAVSGWTSLPWLRRLDLPTLVVAGGADPLVPASTARLLAERLPKARLEMRPSAGHLWLLERAEESSALVTDFLSA